MLVEAKVEIGCTTWHVALSMGRCFGGNRLTESQFDLFGCLATVHQHYTQSRVATGSVV